MMPLSMPLSIPFCFFIPFFTYRVYRIEWALVLACFLICAIARGRARYWLRSLDSAIFAMGRKRRLAILVAGLLPMLVRAALLPVMPIPEPSVHDEFSHLLLGDTFASARITNPPHKLWHHFESIHIIQQPTYTSMYPPALGLALAAGQVIAGNPWWGVWASTGLMCAATCWMLQAWLPDRWAFYGALLLGLRVGIYSFYMNSYFGGEVPGIGGALVLGAVPRLVGRQRPRDAVLLGAGLVILANARPFESAFMGVAVCAVVALWLMRSVKVNFRRFARNAVLPAVAVLAAGGLATSYYCWRTTGNPLRLPYQVNRDTYGWPVHLALLPPVNVTHRHASMHNHYLFEMSTRAYYSTPKAFLTTTAVKIQTAWRFLFGPALTLPILFLPFALRAPRLRYLALAALIMMF